MPACDVPPVIGERAEADALVVRLDRPLPERLAVGAGQILYLTGRCYHPRRALRSLALRVDDVEHEIVNHSAMRSDVPADDPEVGDHLPNSLTSGFWAAIPLPAISRQWAVVLGWRAQLDDGTWRARPGGTLELVPGRTRALPPVSERPRIAICLATDNPEPPFFAAQVESLIRQTHVDWRCIVSDDGSTPDRLRMIREVVGRDARFTVHAHGDRLGSYGNVERALEAVPADAELVALADQDDVWYPDKLAALVAAFADDTMLAYGDVDVLTDDRVVAPTYRTTRHSNDLDLASLIFANTIMGAASVFRAALLRDVLPFPPRIGDAYHAHWIACAALARGTLGHVGRPLQACRQHGGNVPGHDAPAPSRLVSRWEDARRAFGRPDLRRRIMAELWRYRTVYTNEVVRHIVTAKLLLLRVGTAMSASKRASLGRIAALEAAPLGLATEVVRTALTRRPTLGAEWRCLRGVLAACALDVHYRRHRERLFADRQARRALTGGGPSVSATAGLRLIEEKLAPLQLRVDPAARVRVNLLAPAIDPAHLFAGYLGKLHLALRLCDAGHVVRLVIVDRCDYDPRRWQRSLAAYPGLEDLFERVELTYAAERDAPLAVHPRDGFVATTWWTAHLAHGAARALGGRPFVYLIQECEPMTFPMGSLYALASQSYALPHRALFSTELLRGFFRGEQLGVYAPGAPGDAAAMAFENAIATFEVTREGLERPGPRRLLFYARPEQHAARNMFELGVLALRAAVTAGALAPGEWLVEGLGAGRRFDPIPLGAGHRLVLLPRVDLATYRTLLPGYDVGLSLMLTPHPSLVPLEMAAAGLVTVTNTYATKTASALAALSSNLVPVAPTVEDVAAGLATAAARAGDLGARVDGSAVAWSREWCRSFDDAMLQRLGEWLRTS